MADRAELQRLLDNAATKPHEFIAANVIDALPSLLLVLSGWLGVLAVSRRRT
jgi:hypothetical protein